MTFDTAVFEILVDESAHTTAIPYQDSDELEVEVTGNDGNILTVQVNGDSYGISQFQDEVTEMDGLSIEDCRVDIGDGEAQPADKRRMEE